MRQSVMAMRLTTSRCCLFNATFERPDTDKEPRPPPHASLTKPTAVEGSVRSTRFMVGNFLGGLDIKGMWDCLRRAGRLRLRL
jgi:hypothetical protein